MKGEKVTSLVFSQHSLAVSYAPACDCFRLDLIATQRPAIKLIPDFSVSLTISRFGSFGVSR